MTVAFVFATITGFADGNLSQTASEEIVTVDSSVEVRFLWS